MILKNKALLIYDFLAKPTELLYNRAARYHMRGLNDVIAGKTKYEGEMTHALHYFPEVAAALGPKALQTPALESAIKAEPMAALQLLLSDYTGLSKILEPIVTSSAEATYHLLRLAKERKIALAGTPAVYTQTLLADAFWALRYYGDTQDETLLADILQVGKLHKDKTAPGAYIFYYFNIEEDVGEAKELLSSSAMYAYLGSRHFYDRSLEFRYMEVLGLTPRWAYHFITDGFLDDEEGLIETMLASPDWLVEYLVESERYKDLAYTAGVVDRAIKKAVGNPQITYLKLWWERTQVHVKATTPPPKPAKKTTAETPNGENKGQ